MSTRALATAGARLGARRAGRGDSRSRRQARGLAGDRASRRPRARAPPPVVPRARPRAATRRPGGVPQPRPAHRAGRVFLDRGARLATGTGDADPRPRDVVRLHRRPGRGVRGAVHARRGERDARRGRLEHERDRLGERLRAAGDIHRVRNVGHETAISIHVYGTDVDRIGSSVRRYYDQPVVCN